MLIYPVSYLRDGEFHKSYDRKLVVKVRECIVSDIFSLFCFD